MKHDFFKFPSTPHLAVLGDIKIRDDKVMPEAERNRFLGSEMVVEEKIDGANLGISFDDKGNIRIQNRGSYLVLPASGQWRKLSDWLVQRAKLVRPAFIQSMGEHWSRSGLKTNRLESDVLV
jgi:hypothetical protein